MKIKKKKRETGKQNNHRKTKTNPHKKQNLKNIKENKTNKMKQGCNRLQHI